MCNPTYPIFRCAAVISTTGDVTPEQTVGIGTRLSESSADFTDQLIAFVTRSSEKLFNVRLADGEEKDEPRVRVEPAIIVDFPVLRFVWRDHHLESRISVTTWAGKRKAKLWIRINFIDAVRNNNLICDFFKEMLPEGKRIQEFALHYMDSRLGGKYHLKTIYGINMYMVSSPDERLSLAFHDHWDLIERPNSNLLREVLLAVFKEDFGFTPDRGRGSKRFVESYAFPLIDPRIMAERRGIDPVDLRTMVLQEIAATDELKAGVIIDTYDDHADIWGIVYEKEPISKHASGPLIVSGELSLELGRLY